MIKGVHTSTDVIITTCPSWYCPHIFLISPLLQMGAHNQRSLVALLFCLADVSPNPKMELFSAPLHYTRDAGWAEPFMFTVYVELSIVQ